MKLILILITVLLVLDRVGIVQPQPAMDSLLGMGMGMVMTGAFAIRIAGGVATAGMAQTFDPGISGCGSFGMSVG